MLSKIFMKPATVDKLKADYEAALVRQESAKSAWGDALLADLDGGFAAAELDRLEKELNRAMAEAAQAKARLDSAIARASKAESDASDASLRASWKRAVALAEDRTRSAERLAEVSAKFASAYMEFLKVTADLTDALPRNLDRDAAILPRPSMDEAIRKELLRLGVDWAYSWPWGRVSLPEFLPRFRDAEGLVKTWAESALDRKR